MYNNAQKKATIKYMATKLDEIKFRVPKGQKEIIKKCANSIGMSMTAFIIEAIQEKAERLGYSIINKSNKDNH